MNAAFAAKRAARRCVRISPGPRAVRCSHAVNGNGDTVNASENARQPVIQPDGKAVLASYSGIAATVAGSALANRPFVARFNTDGTLDSGFGDPANGAGGGVGSGQPLGVNPSFSEA
jgi:hypothetical protein